MEFLLNLWSESNTLTQILTIIIIIVGVYKGVLVLPFVNIKKKQRKTHEECNLYHDMNEIIKNAIIKSQKISKIKDKDIIRDQMNSLEVTHNEILYKMKSIYHSHVKNDKDIAHYNELLDNLEHDIRSMIKAWFRENHLTEKSDKDYRDYVSTRIGLILSRVTDTLNYKYKNFELDRQKLQDIHREELIPFAVEKYTDIFYLARDISQKYETRIKELESQ